MFSDWSNDPFFGGLGAGRQHSSGSRRDQRNDELANPDDFMRNPFSMMDRMMGNMGSMMPFGRGLGMGIGMGDGRDPFEGFDLVNMNDRGGQGGNFMCQTMVMSSTMGEDGKMHTEKFASNSVGDFGRQIHQKEQAYSNSKTGIDKMSLERQIKDKGRRMIKERTRGQDDVHQTDYFRGMPETDANAFDDEWNQEAQPHISRLQAEQWNMQGLMRLGGPEQFVRGYSRRGEAVEDDPVRRSRSQRDTRRNDVQGALPNGP